MTPVRAKSSVKKPPPSTLTYKQLSAHDDVITDALVDHVYFWTTIRKNHHYYKPERLLNERQITDILQKHIILAADPKEATKQVQDLAGIKKYMGRLQKGPATEHFQKHLEKYVHIYLPDCPWEITTTNRYTITEMEASVTARKHIKRGQVVKYLCGTMVNLTSEDEAELDFTRRSFSIVHSSRKKTMSLFLGPARLANHDCQPNARLTSMESNKMEVMALQSIQVNEEITVSYGEDYFGLDNCECLCSTCEKLQRNGWSSDTGPARTREVSSPVDFLAGLDPWGYSLRSQHGKRELPADFLSGSGTSTPELPEPKRQRSSSQEQKAHSLAAPPSIIRASSNLSMQTERMPTPLRQVVSTTDIEDAASESRICTTSKLRDEEAEIRAEESDSSLAVNLLPLPYETSRKSTPPTSISEDELMTHKIEDSENPQTPDVVNTPITVTTETIVQTTEMTADNILVADVITALTTTTQIKSEAESELSELSEVDLDPQTVMKIQSLLPPSSKDRARKKKSIRHSLINAEGPKTRRIPGDYLTDKSLLAKPASKKLQCQSCRGTFVQENAYEPHADCPRCERHSKLHGFPWPKSERDGEHDKEIRYLDHRAINRTIAPGYKSNQASPGTEEGCSTPRANKKPLKAPLKGGIWKGWVPPEQEWEQIKKEARKANNRELKKTTVKKKKKVTATSAAKPSGVTKTVTLKDTIMTTARTRR